MSEGSDSAGGTDRSDRSDRSGRPNGTDDPQSAVEALARARDHARNATAEALLALRALLDAAALGVSAEPAADHRVLATLARTLDDLSLRFATGNTDVSSLILAALDAEIARWEGRSRDDPESRAVLRAFLGMREILWEFGIRSGGSSRGETDGSNGDENPTEPSTPRRKPSRVQRVEVRG